MFRKVDGDDGLSQDKIQIEMMQGRMNIFLGGTQKQNTNEIQSQKKKKDVWRWGNTWLDMKIGKYMAWQNSNWYSGWIACTPWLAQGKKYNMVSALLHYLIDSSQSQSPVREGITVFIFMWGNWAWKERSSYLCKVKQLVSGNLGNRIQAWLKGTTYL